MGDDSPQRRLSLGAWAALACLATAGSPSGAQSIRFQPEVETSVTFTSNAAAAVSDARRPDTVLTLNPRISATSRRGRSSIDGTFGLELVGFANNSQDSVVRPRGDLSLRSEVVDRLFFVNASVSANRVGADGVGARPESATAFNDYSRLRYRLSPSIERALTPRFNFLASTDHVVTRRLGTQSANDPGGTDPARDAHEQQQVLRLELRPQPFGWSGEVTRQSTQLRGSEITVLTQTAARFVGSYAVNAQLVLGVGGGRERNAYSLIEREDAVTSARIQWNPDGRSEFDGRIEKRFFGIGADLEWRHRSPYFGFSVRANRTPVAQSGSHLLGAAGDNLSQLLDGILATRYPDPALRASAVQDLVRQLNLPGTLAQPIELYTSYAQLQENASATVLFFGRVTTAAATVFTRRRERLVGVEDVLAPASLSGDNFQVGVELDMSRRLSPVLTASAGARYIRVEGVGTRSDQASRDASVRVGLSRVVSPDTRLSFNLRHQAIASTVTSPSSETALVVALVHRF